MSFLLPLGKGAWTQRLFTCCLCMPDYKYGDIPVGAVLRSKQHRERFVLGHSHYVTIHIAVPTSEVRELVTDEQ